MTQIQPLETYKVGSYRTPIACQLCGEHNLFDATTCSNCSAPMGLSRTTDDSGHRIRPQLIVPVGASGTGKTVYLGMLLDILSRQGDRSDITTHGTNSVTVQHEVITSLAPVSYTHLTLPTICSV